MQRIPGIGCVGCGRPQAGETENLVSSISQWLIREFTRVARRYLVGSKQRWIFEPPAQDWCPQPVESTSLYLHVPFCRHLCPYCPYTKVAYHESLVEPYTQAALAEVDWWADAVGRAEITSLYIGGGTPTLALDSVARVLERVRERFNLAGDICIETNPADVNPEIVKRLHDMGVGLVSLGLQSFQPESLALIGRDYDPACAENSLALLAGSGFASVNVDLMFALPGQPVSSVLADLRRAAELGANQITAYPLFTFPYTSVGEHLRLKAVRMPKLKMRREHYRAISGWCSENGFARTSVWGFKKGGVPRYSSVTRNGYIGIGPGAGSQLADGFILNTFDLRSWAAALEDGKSAVALRMPFAGEMSGWWWLYWRLYDTSVPLAKVDSMLGRDAPRALGWLKMMEQVGFARRNRQTLDLTEPGAFWLHLAQNYFALNYVNTLWTRARREPWPRAIEI